MPRDYQPTLIFGDFNFSSKPRSTREHKLLNIFHENGFELIQKKFTNGNYTWSQNKKVSDIDHVFGNFSVKFFEINVLVTDSPSDLGTDHAVINVDVIATPEIIKHTRIDWKSLRIPKKNEIIQTDITNFIQTFIENSNAHQSKSNAYLNDCIQNITKSLLRNIPSQEIHSGDSIKNLLVPVAANIDLAMSQNLHARIQTFTNKLATTCSVPDQTALLSKWKKKQHHKEALFSKSKSGMNNNMHTMSLRWKQHTPVSHTPMTCDPPCPSDQDIYNIKEALNIRKAPDPDDLPQLLFKIYRRQFTTLILQIIKLLSQGVKFNLLNKATVVPVFKKEDKNLITKYRPIAFIPVLRRIIERYLDTCINWNQYEYPFQFGFKKFHSTADLALTLNKILKFSKKTHVLSLDISQAYDSVDLKLLLSILKEKLPKNLFNCISSMFTGCSAKLKGPLFESDYFSLKNGLLQGSPLAPKLFNIYIAKALSNIKMSKPEINFFKNSKLSFIHIPAFCMQMI